MRNIKYLGTKTSKAFFHETGLIWKPGMIDTVIDDDVASRMVQHGTVFEDLGDANLAAVQTAVPIDPVTGVAGLNPDAEPLRYRRIASAITSASGKNPQVLPPYAPAPTWAQSTSYGGGITVRGTGSDAQNLYLLAGSTTTSGFATGVSASSGTGPSGAGESLITDGTCKWLYIGKASATTAIPFISTATPTVSTDEMNGYIQTVVNTSLAGMGLTIYRPINTTGSFSTEAFVSGGIFEKRVQGRVAGSNSGTAALQVYNSNDERGSIKFTTNSRKWIALKTQGVLPQRRAYQVIINGRNLGESDFVLSADQSGYSLLLNLSVFGTGTKEVEIRMADNLQTALAFEFCVEASASVWPTKFATGLRFSLEGDSVINGSFFTGYKPRYWLERIIGDQIGIDYVYNNAQGGTGFINNGGTKTKYIDRLQDVVDFSPDIHFIGGLANDLGESGDYTSANRVSAVLAYLTAVRAALPSALIVLQGCHLLQGAVTTAGATTSMQAEIDAKSAFDTFADSNSLFIPILTDSRQKFGSANGVFFQNVSSPYNNAHPIPPYYQFIGGLIAQKIADFVSGRV